MSAYIRRTLPSLIEAVKIKISRQLLPTELFSFW